MYLSVCLSVKTHIHTHMYICIYTDRFKCMYLCLCVDIHSSTSSCNIRFPCWYEMDVSTGLTELEGCIGFHSLL